MNIRPFFHFFLLAMLGCAAYGAEKPNVILINADDLGWAELGSYGQAKIKTPNIDRLAEQGQRWTDFYSGAPVCSPSRNVLMTGLHTGHTDVQDLKRVDPREGPLWENFKGDWPIAAEAYTLPEAMKKAGYATGVFGKWGLGEYGTTGAPDKHGIDTFYGYTDHRMCHTYYPAYLWDNDKKDVINDPPIPGHASKPKGEINADDYRGTTHASDRIADHAIQFILSQKGSKKPFFVYYAPLEPHVSMQPLQKWVDEYPKEWDTKPYRGMGGYLPHPRPRAAYGGMISQMDNNVGRLMEALKQIGADKNTLVIFTSDNGTTHDVGGVDHNFFNSVRGLRGLKGQLYEGGIRVPGIFCWPGKIKEGSVIGQPAYGADIMPTICSLVKAGSGKPDGVDLSPILLGKQTSFPTRKPMVWTGGGYEGQVAVRIGDLKAIRRKLNPQIKQGPDNWEVYNISQDPNEKTNIAASERKAIDKAVDVLKKEYKASKGYPTLRYDAPEKTAAP